MQSLPHSTWMPGELASSCTHGPDPAYANHIARTDIFWGWCWMKNCTLTRCYPLGSAPHPTLCLMLSNGLQNNMAFPIWSISLMTLLQQWAPTAMNASITLIAGKHLLSPWTTPEIWKTRRTCYLPHYFRDRAWYCAPWAEATKTKIGLPAIYDSEMEPFKMLE